VNNLPKVAMQLLPQVGHEPMGRTARVVQFVCIIPAIMPTIATVSLKLTATEMDSFR